jgi:ketosteroid isomerase-like protein
VFATRPCCGRHQFRVRRGFSVIGHIVMICVETLLPSCFVKYDRHMLQTITLLLALTAAAFGQNSAKDQTQIWELEKAYWEYVKANDLEKYRALWHENFVGWPFVSTAPVRKDHITDWITSNTSKGIKLQSYSIEQLAIQVTGDIAINYYRINATWADSTRPEGRTDRLRITHTLIRTHGTWQIIGGMSSPLNATGQ